MSIKTKYFSVLPHSGCQNICKLTYQLLILAFFSFQFKETMFVIFLQWWKWSHLTASFHFSFTTKVKRDIRAGVSKWRLRTKICAACSCLYLLVFGLLRWGLYMPQTTHPGSASAGSEGSCWHFNQHQLQGPYQPGSFLSSLAAN